jgi:hypothetical protein
MNLVGLIQVKVMIRDRDSLTRILIDSYWLHSKCKLHIRIENTKSSIRNYITNLIIKILANLEKEIEEGRF